MAEANTTNGIAPPTVEVRGNHAVVALSFGPEARIIPNKDGDGFTLMVLRQPAGPLSVPVLHARVRFGPQLQPIIEGIEARVD